MEAIFSAVITVVGAVLWLAYHHPGAFSKLATVCAAIAYMVLAGLFGIRIGIAIAVAELQQMKPLPTEAIAALGTLQVPSWLFWTPAVLVTVLFAFELFPLFGFTEEGRYNALRRKLGPPGSRR
jgi:hypothetical protein